MTKPKLRSVALDRRDIFKGLLPPETIVGVHDSKTGSEIQVAYKYRTAYWYGHSSEQRIQWDDSVIQGTLDKCIRIIDLPIYLDWVKKNCTWHKTTLNYRSPKSVVLTDLDVTLVDPDFGDVIVNSIVHRKQTDEQRADLAKLRENKDARLKREKAETAKRAAAKRKAEAERKRKESITHEFGDLAGALATLKKHGLKVVTVDEPRTKKKA
jgi:hypothetical protein